MDHSPPHETPTETGHELREVNIKLILLSTLIMVIAVLVSCFLTVGIFNYLSSTQAQPQRANDLAHPIELPKAPRVQVQPSEEYRVLHANEARVLNSYAWVSEADGTVRIPIDRAIDLVAERGLPLEPSSSKATKAVTKTKPAGSPVAAATGATASLSGEGHGGK